MRAYAPTHTAAVAILHSLPQRVGLQEQAHSTFNLQTKHPAILTPSSYPAVHVADTLRHVLSLCEVLK